jgi:hypothetical protein
LFDSRPAALVPNALYRRWNVAGGPDDGPESLVGGRWSVVGGRWSVSAVGVDGR